MRLIVFGAEDGSRLALIARSHSSFDVVQQHLSPKALRVALVIVGQGDNETDAQVKATAEYFSRWATQNFRQRAAVAALT